MKHIIKISTLFVTATLILAGFLSCQNFEEPPMHIIPDPAPAPYSAKKISILFNNGNVADNSIYGIQTENKNITFVSGADGEAMLGGANKYVLIDTLDAQGQSIVDNLSVLDGFTISFWMYMTADQANLMNTGRAYGIFSVSNPTTDWKGNLDVYLNGFNTNGDLELVMHMANYSTGTENNIWPGRYLFVNKMVDKWTHVALRYNASTSTVSYFRDGQLVFKNIYDNYGTIHWKNMGKMVLGTFQDMTTPSLGNASHSEWWTYEFPGKIDNFEFYTEALSDDNIKTIYNSVTPPDPITSPLKLWLTFDNGNALDYSDYQMASIDSTSIDYVNAHIAKGIQSGEGKYILVNPSQSGLGDITQSVSEMDGFTGTFWMYISKAQASLGNAMGILSFSNRYAGWTGNLDIYIDGYDSGNDNLQIRTHIANYRTNAEVNMWAQGYYFPQITDKWVQIAYRYNGSNSTFSYFLNGIKVWDFTQTNFGAVKFINMDRIVLGTFQNFVPGLLTFNPAKEPWQRSFPGQLDQFRFYNKALNDAEIKGIYDTEK